MKRFYRMALFFLVATLLLVALCHGMYLAAAGLEHLAITRWRWPRTYGAAISNVFMLMLVLVFNIGALLTVAERKWSAMMQNRIGPNRIRFFGTSAGGVFFLLADALKMITKESAAPVRRSRLLYLAAPVISFVPALLLFAVVPVGPPVDVRVGSMIHTVALQVASIDAGLLFVFGTASLAVYGTALAGWASNSKLALLGGVRAASQMISYEVALGLSLVGAMMAYRTLRLERMVEAQGDLVWGFLPALGIFLQPVALLVFFVAAMAETKRAPFDLPEGESEIVGYFVEYPGMKFGMMFLSEFIEVVVLAAVLATVFLGGWHPIFFEATLREFLGAGSVAWAALCAGAFLIKVILLCWLQLVVRWTLPRFRIDQVQALCWKMLLPVSLANVFVTGALVLADPSLRLLTAVGLSELTLLAIVTFAAGRQAQASDASPATGAPVEH